MIVPANGAFARPIRNSCLGGKITKSFSGVVSTSRLFAPMAPFPLARCGNAVFPMVAVRFMYSFGDIVGGQKVGILMSSNSDVISVLLILCPRGRPRVEQWKGGERRRISWRQALLKGVTMWMDSQTDTNKQKVQWHCTAGFETWWVCERYRSVLWAVCTK